MGEFGLDSTQMIIALIVGIILLIYMILRTKIHTFLALIIAALFIGVVGGIPVESVITAVETGFGSTLGSIGIIIGFGVMMGAIFEKSGAAERMAYTFIKLFGKGREEEALAVTGFIVSIPIFVDSGFVILVPIAKALSRATKKSIVSLSVALASGLVITHSLVPPTPGPVGVAGIFGANVGSVILWGIILGIPMAIASIIYARWIGKRIYQIPGDVEGGEEWVRPNQDEVKVIDAEFDTEHLPSTAISFAPIVVPLIMILLGTFVSLFDVSDTVQTIVNFIGSPIVAVGTGLLVAIIFLAKHMSRSETIDAMEAGISSAGIILLVTGGGGALGEVLTISGVGEYLSGFIANSSVPALLIPFLISTLMRFVQGSGTVAMITAASMTAPIMQSLGVDPVFATLSACIGSLFMSHFNDSFFHVVNRSIGIKEAKEQIQVWSAPTTIMWAIGFISLLIVNAFFG